MAALLLLLPAAAASGGGKCASDEDCSLLGSCSGGACAGCRSGWIGPHCEVLDLTPAPPDAGLQMPHSASWGGAVVFWKGAYHMLSALSTLRCDILSYQTNCLLLHATAATPHGPFTPSALPRPDHTYAPGINGTFAPRPPPAWDSESIIG